MKLPSMKELPKTVARTRALCALLLCGAGSGCTYTPDPCLGWEQACLAVTVDSGPSDTYQLLVVVLDGYGSTTPLTPRKLPAQPLLYPLRFAIRFAPFDDSHMGTIRFTIEAENHTGDPVGYLLQSVSINGQEHDQIEVALGPPGDMALNGVLPDLGMASRSDLGRSDLAGLPADSGP
jgi:hypothetical protein